MTLAQTERAVSALMTLRVRVPIFCCLIWPASKDRFNEPAYAPNCTLIRTELHPYSHRIFAYRGGIFGGKARVFVRSRLVSRREGAQGLAGPLFR
jgi:hypothetical protein